VAGGLSVGKNVIAALAQVAPQHEYLLVLPAGVGYEQVPKPPGAWCTYYRRTHGKPGQWLYERWAVPRQVRRFRPDVVWGLGNFGLVRPTAPQAFLFHLPQLIYDVRDQPRPLWHLTWKLRTLRRRLVRGLRYTQLVFCQTQTAAERFPRVFGYHGRVALMANAVSRFLEGASAPPTPAVFETLGDRFVLLCLSKYYEHKNLDTLADLFESHGEQLAEVTVILTVDSAQHRKAPAFISRIRQPHLRKHLVNVGPIGQEEIAGYFTASKGLILPTLLESFSGAYLEAMHFGRPILTSDRDFAREVCGEAARYFDPYEPASIRDAILELRDSADLRRRLVAAGRRQQERYVRDWPGIVADAMREVEALAKGHAH
jgi:glycosyltransferase involved in cell wall biosynthesis